MSRREQKFKGAKIVDSSRWRIKPESSGLVETWAVPLVQEVIKGLQDAGETIIEIEIPETIKATTSKKGRELTPAERAIPILAGLARKRLPPEDRRRVHFQLSEEKKTVLMKVEPRQENSTERKRSQSR